MVLGCRKTTEENEGEGRERRRSKTEGVMASSYHLGFASDGSIDGSPGTTTPAEHRMGILDESRFKQTQA